jgi:hypothetical protein
MKYSLLMILLAVPAVLAQNKGATPDPVPGSVTMPLDEYNKLVELADKPTSKPERPPVPYTVNRASLKLQVTGESVSGTIEIEGEVLATGATKVPLAGAVTLLDARQQGRPLPLQQADGVNTAVLTGPGEFAVTLDAGIRLNIDAGRASFALPAPSAGAVQLTLTVPGEHTDVEISPGLVTGRTSSGGQTIVDATLEPGRVATIGWATREKTAPVFPREVRFLSDVKTLVSVSEARIGLAALVDITVVQGEPQRFELAIPAGYEVTGASGSSLESSDVQSGVLILTTATPALRSHQFLVSMERTVDNPKAEVPFLSFKGAQRETGEVLVESQGTMELAAAETGGLKRMDLKESNPSLRSLAQNTLQAAFRYHRQPAEPLGLALNWVRFPDSNVLAAVAERAVVTTLVTSEGRSLTEVTLVLRNQAQPFLKVELPAGASILSADVAGEKVKPVTAPDGARVPLLRAGFHPSGDYKVSFVFLHSGAPFAKKGGSEIALPKMDLPIGLLEWEVFLPERYKVKDFGGDAISTNLLPVAERNMAAEEEAPEWQVTGHVDLKSMGSGVLGGYVVAQAGGLIPNAVVTVVEKTSGIVHRATTDAGGRWRVSNVSSGTVAVTASASGFNRFQREFDYDARRPMELQFTLKLGTLTEQIEVNGRDAGDLMHITPGLAKEAAAAANAPSSNVGNLQRRVAGVLPIAVDVPHAGNSYRFVRPLVLDEETRVTFDYKTR